MIAVCVAHHTHLPSHQASSCLWSSTPWIVLLGFRRHGSCMSETLDRLARRGFNLPDFEPRQEVMIQQLCNGQQPSEHLAKYLIEALITLSSSDVAPHPPTHG